MWEVILEKLLYPVAIKIMVWYLQKNPQQPLAKETNDKLIDRLVKEVEEKQSIKKEFEGYREKKEADMIRIVKIALNQGINYAFDKIEKDYILISKKLARGLSPSPYSNALSEPTLAERSAKFKSK